MKDFELQYTKAASYVKATGFIKDKKDKNQVVMEKVGVPEDENKRLENKDTTFKDFAKPVGDIEVCYY